MAKSFCRHAGRTSSKLSGAILLGLLVLGSTINVANALIINSYAFGDSTSDVGTNNVLPSSNPFTPKANFRPYGETFFNYPTGRFCDGRLSSDFILTDLLLPFSIPYLQAVPFFHGNNFASAGSGILDNTNSYQGVINLSTQISQFQSTIAGLKGLLGPIVSDLLIKQSLVSFSTGSNDFSVYFTNATLQATVPFPVYVQSMVDKLVDSVQKTIDAGARKIAVSGIGPIGCTPQAKAGVAAAAGFNSTPPNPSAIPCFATGNQAAQAYNSLLIPRLNAINAANNATVLYVNSYGILSEILANYQSSGFVESSVACCGGGSFNGVTQCGLGTYNLCPNPSRHVFWDYQHPTEATYRIIADKIFNGNTTYVSPINVKQLSLQFP